MMDNDRKREIEKCLNCGSENLIGPYDYMDAFLKLSFLNNVRLKAFVCVDCHHAMLFIRDKHRRQIIVEAAKNG